MSGSGRQRLFSSFDRPRRRFVQDGEVPVTVVHARPRQGLDALGPPRSGASPLERAESAEAALATERAARDQAERHLREAQATILDLRTKQGHADLARAEADAAAAALRAEFADMRAELAAAQAALATAQEALARQAATPALAAPRRGRRMAREAVAHEAEISAAADQPVAAVPVMTAAPGADTPVLDESGAGLAPVRRGPGRPRGSKSAPKVLARPKPVARTKPLAKPKSLAKPKPKAAARPAPKAARPKPVQWWVKRPARGKPAAVRKRSPRAF